jgi:hypothetical protein
LSKRAVMQQRRSSLENASRPTIGTTSLQNCAPLPQVESMGYHIGRAVPWENHHCEKHGNTQISPNLTHKLWNMLAPGIPVLATSAVWPWCRRSFQDICRGLWIIIAELICGLFPMIFRVVCPSCQAMHLPPAIYY